MAVTGNEQVTVTACDRCGVAVAVDGECVFEYGERTNGEIVCADCMGGDYE